MDEPLRIVYHVAHQDPIMVLFPVRQTNDTMHRLDYCFNQLKYSVVESTLESFRGYIKVSLLLDRFDCFQY